jgi:Flp pilus assembly protein CpaB
MIKPGDYVDVIAILPPTAIPIAEGRDIVQKATVPLFQNVLVLAVGGQLSASPAEEEAGGRWSWAMPPREKEQPQQRKQEVLPLVTLALPPQEASLLSFISEQGKVRLVMRSQADATVQPLPPANWETFFAYVNSKLPPQPKQDTTENEPEEAPVIIKEPRKIEIYRGLNKEYITLSE